MNVAAVLDAYRVDTAHARHVADLSLALFDAVRERYDLPAGARRLVELGGLLHNVGLTTDPPAHHLVGRDIVLRHGLDELSPREQAIVASMVAFHRKKVHAKQEPAYLSLGKKGRALALRLAAILRVGDGLDYSQSQTTRLLALEPIDGGLSLRLEGPQAPSDGSRAVAKADLWERVFGEPLITEAPPAAVSLDGAQPEGATDEAPILLPWYAAPEAPLAELGRVLLRRYLRKLLAAERDVRADKEIEAVHALRVASRRLRAALRLLEPVLDPDELRPHARAIRRLAHMAGAVRDRDVLLADITARAEALPAELRPGLDELSAALQGARASAHRNLIALLDSPAHADFTHDFAALMSRHSGWDDGPRVRDIAGSTIWRHYEALRAYDRGGLPQEQEALHAMRIAGKHLRYVAELFSDTFGQRSATIVDPLVAFQDHLGALQDSAVARETLTHHAHSDAARAAIDAYAALRAADDARAQADLPARWEKVSSGTYRRNLMGLIVKL
jgi:CHAD domain-containing protein